jgi:hypothetical protein
LNLKISGSTKVIGAPLTLIKPLPSLTWATAVADFFLPKVCNYRVSISDPDPYIFRDLRKVHFLLSGFDELKLLCSAASNGLHMGGNVDLRGK